MTPRESQGRTERRGTCGRLKTQGVLFTRVLTGYIYQAVFDSCHSGTLLDLGIYRMLSRMSDITQESADKALNPARVDSVPNPNNSSTRTGMPIVKVRFTTYSTFCRTSDKMIISAGASDHS